MTGERPTSVNLACALLLTWFLYGVYTQLWENGSVLPMSQEVPMSNALQIRFYSNLIVDTLSAITIFLLYRGSNFTRIVFFWVTFGAIALIVYALKNSGMRYITGNPSDAVYIFSFIAVSFFILYLLCNKEAKRWYTNRK